MVSVGRFELLGTKTLQKHDRNLPKRTYLRWRRQRRQSGDLAGRGVVLRSRTGCWAGWMRFRTFRDRRIVRLPVHANPGPFWGRTRAIWNKIETLFQFIHFGLIESTIFYQSKRKNMSNLHHVDVSKFNIFENSKIQFPRVNVLCVLWIRIFRECT